MKFAWMVLGLLAWTAACSEEHWSEPEEDDVVVLTAKNFDSFIKAHDRVFVKFYAPWCGHCKSMAPAYSELGRRMKKEKNGIPIAKVDATAETDIGQRFQVRGFPTLKLFQKGEAIDYKGPREEKDMFEWISTRNQPRAKRVDNISNLDKLEQLTLAVLYILPEEDTTALDKFEAVASTYEKIPFLYTHDDAARDKYDADEKYVIVLYRNFDDGKKFLMNKEALSTESIKAFFNTLRYPMVMEFDQEAAERIFEGQLASVILFSDERKTQVAKDMEELAPQHAGKLVFTVSPITRDFGKKLSEYLGISEKEQGAIRIIEFRDGNLNKFKCEVHTKSDLERCLKDHENRSLEQIYKSEEPPATNDEPVKVVVGKTFEKMVLKSDKHVLVEAYAPWCGHCKSLAPIYEDLARRLQNQGDIVIAKVDGSANEMADFEIKGFPTIRLYRRGHKQEPIEFDGERTLKGLLGFLQKHTGLTLDDGTDTIGSEL